MQIVAIGLVLGLAACASTSSVVLPPAQGRPHAAMLPLEGSIGAEASDLISQELGRNGVAVAERAQVVPFIAVDTDLSGATPDAVRSFTRLGRTLHVDYLFAGTVTTNAGPLSSYPHVFMTLRLIDIRSGQTRWIGQYGNSLWSSAISEQGDLQRGARDIVEEFIKTGGAAILNN